MVYVPLPGVEEAAARPFTPTASSHLGKVRLLIKLGGLRQRHNPNNGARRKMSANWTKLQAGLRTSLLASALHGDLKESKGRFDAVVQQQKQKAEMREKGMGSAKLTLEVDEDEGQTPGKLWEQGDAEMYTQENLDRRYGLRHDPAVARMLNMWWATVQRFLKARRKNPNRLLEEEYKVIFLKVYKLMMPGEDYVVSEARMAVHEDWATDCGPRGFLTRDTFIDALFELADVWTLTTEAHEYHGFLKSLHDKITKDGEFLDDADLVAGSGKPDGFDEAIEEAEREQARLITVAARGVRGGSACGLWRPRGSARLWGVAWAGDS